MLDERLQFRILFRDSVFRMIDLELLSAGGDVGKLLGQVAALLSAIGFTFLVVTAPKYLASGLSPSELLAATRAETDFLFATTMAAAGLFAMLAWNAILPDRRDCSLLGVLPVRLRTVFLARVTAISAAVGAAVFALNIFPGLCYPFLSLPPGAGIGGALRGFAAYWLSAGLMGLFVCCSVLAVQAVSVLLLSHRLFLRLSGWIQFAAFFLILAAYFLRPPLPSNITPDNLGVTSRLPSFWFYSLWLNWNGAASPVLRPFAARALWGLAFTAAIGGLGFALAFHRSVRRIVEQPDIAPADRSRPAAPIGRFLARLFLRRPLDRAIVLFTARTMFRSRQHRLLLAAYGGVGMAIALVYVKDLLYGYSGGLWDSLGVNVAANSHWDRVNVPFLAGSFVLLCFAILGARATFALPIALPANWIFRITAVHSPAAYFSAARKAIFALAAVPIWIAAALIFFAIWPAVQATEHVALLIAIGILLVEISLYRFRKIPFGCSYLPGKANINVRLGAYAMLFLFVADRGVAVEYWAMEHTTGFLILFGVVTAAAIWARRRASDFANAPGNRIRFDDVPPSEVLALDLRQDGNWSNDDACFNAIDTRNVESARSKPSLIGLNLNEAPPASVEVPRMPLRVQLEQLLQDFRHAARAFRNSPVLSAVTVLLIALGLGANLTIYSIIHSILDKPAPAVEAGGLVMFSHSIDGQLAEGGPSNSYPNYLDLAAQTKTISALTASVAAPWLTLTLQDATYEVRGEMLAANYFQTLGVSLVRGRTFTEAESRGIGGLSVVIAYELWRNQFHGADNIVGQTIAVNGHPATIVGIVAEGFHGVALVPHFEIGLPLPGFSRIQGSEGRLLDRTWGGVTIIGRLAPGVSLSRAKTEFAALSDRLEALHPVENRGWTAVLAPYTRTVFGPNSSPQARRLMGGVSLIGLLALLAICANIASLLLGRSMARSREMAVRISVGASRLRLVRMLAAEGLMLSLTACLAAWFLTLRVTHAVGKLAPPLESGIRFPLDLAPDGRVLAYGMALAILATLAFSLAAAPGIWLRQIHPLLKGSEHSVIRGGSRPLNALVIAQLALCTVLVTAGSLSYQSVFYIDRSDLYFTRDHLLLASVNTAGAASGGKQNMALLERIRQRLRSVPGVVNVSWATAAPPHDHGWMDLPVRAVGSDRSTVTDGTIAGPDYIETLGVPELAGRDFSAADPADARATAVINRKLAGALWPRESALGKTILLGEGRQPIEIVGVIPNGAFSGVAKDGSMTGIGKAERPNFVFLCERPDFSAPGGKTFHIRYTGGLERLIPAVRGAVREVDGRVPVFSVRTMDDEFLGFTAPIRIITALIGIFAATALLLSFVGLYAAIAFHTARRKREFGIRSALGGTPWQVLRAVLKQGLVLTMAGVAVGLTLTAVIARIADGLLFGVDPTDKATYLAVAGLLALISLAASYVPARHASRADPMVVLRQD